MILKDLLFNNAQAEMFSRNSLVCILVCTIDFASFIFLVRLTFNQSEHLMASSKPRLNAFVIVHLVIVAMMVWFSRLDQTYQYVRWGFCFSLSIAVIISGVEVTILAKRLNNKGYDIKAVEPLELAYLNCYFIIYMYSLIASFLSGLFFCCTHCCIKLRDRQIRQAIKDSIFPIQYSNQLAQIDCSICISPLQPEEELLQIKCKHIFHRSCLLQWIKEKQTCPTCRYDVFQALTTIRDPFAALF